MHNSRIKYIMALTMAMGLIAVAFIFVVKKFLAAEYFIAWPLVPALFFLLGLVPVALSAVRSRLEKRWALWLMIIRGLRLAIMIAMVVIFLTVFQVPRMCFAVGFMLCYFTFLFFETWAFSMFGLVKKNN